MCVDVWSHTLQKMILYHGTRNETLALHPGLCLTPSESSASNYAGTRGEVYEVEIDLSGLRVLAVSTGDRDLQNYAGDQDLSSYDADVIVYDDEDTHGRQHKTYRIVTSAAIARISV